MKPKTAAKPKTASKPKTVKKASAPKPKKVSRERFYSPVAQAHAWPEQSAPRTALLDDLWKCCQAVAD